MPLRAECSLEEARATGIDQHELHNDVTSFRTKAVDGLALLSNRMGQVDAGMINGKKMICRNALR